MRARDEGARCERAMRTRDEGAATRARDEGRAAGLLALRNPRLRPVVCACCVLRDEGRLQGRWPRATLDCAPFCAPVAFCAMRAGCKAVRLACSTPAPSCAPVALCACPVLRAAQDLVLCVALDPAF